MRVDVHTHIWPDRIAPAVLENMVGTFGYPAVGINTVDGIKEHMRASGVDKSVVLGVVERLDHLPGANDWLISIQDDMLVPFGAMHPDLEDKPAEVRRMREAGIKGFKLHPMVNSYYPDDPRMFPFYEEMGDDMVVEIHSGRWAHTQPGDTVWAEPARIMNVVRQFPKLKLIALHLGGFYMLDEAERELIGRDNVLIDTTWPPALKELGSETLAGIVSRHGAEKGLLRHRLPAGRHGRRRQVHRVAAPARRGQGADAGRERAGADWACRVKALLFKMQAI